MSKVVTITQERRIEVIRWINIQDIFRCTSLFDVFNVGITEDERQPYRVIINSAKRAGYLQTVDKGRYILLSVIPEDLKSAPNGKWQEPKL